MKSLSDYPSCKRTYVTICLYSRSSHPDDVTSVLGLSPTRISTSNKYKMRGWFYSTQGLVFSNDYRRHVEHIEKLLESRYGRFLLLTEKNWDAKLACFWESATGNGGPEVDVSISQFLIKTQMTLEFDIWID